MAPSPKADLCVVSTTDLFSRTPESTSRLSAALAQAFGPSGPGILAVSGVPAWYGASRRALLSCARAFASLPPARKAAYERAESDYAVGWSCGRERFRGRPDARKGSFYANPVFDDAADGDCARGGRFRHLLGRNVWPEEVRMEGCFKKVGAYVDALAKELAWHCDRYVEGVVGCGGDAGAFLRMEDVLRESRSQKGRLLHYFPDFGEGGGEAGDEAGGFWVGFHNDHGALTGLVSGEFYSEDKECVLGASPDAEAGLYVVPRGAAAPQRVEIPAACIAFQAGEVAQILSGGVLCATPHAVRSVRSVPGGERVSRAAMAVFLQPQPDRVLRLPRWDEEGEKALVSSELVPSLRERFSVGDTFDSFGSKSIEAYIFKG